MRNIAKMFISVIICTMLIFTSLAFATTLENVSEDEFKLTCDYKTIKGENVKVYYESTGRYGYAHLEEGTYVKFVELIDETAEVEVFFKESIQKAWISAESLTTATTIIKDSNGVEKHISELDPDYESILASSKVISKAGTYNPLTKDGEKAASVQKFLQNSDDYVYDGIELEDAPSNTKDSKKQDETKANNKKDNNKKTNNKSFKANLKANVNEVDGTKIFAEPSLNSEELIIVPQNNQIDVQSVGVAWSYVLYDGKKGYVATKSLDFEGADSEKELVVISATNGKLTLRAEANTNSKRLATVKNGNVGVLLGKENKFVKLIIDGKTGYLMENFVKLVKPIDDVSKTAAIIYPNSKKKTKINIRTSNSKTSFIVDKIATGELVTILSEDEKWTAIETSKGLYGYIMNEFISK